MISAPFRDRSRDALRKGALLCLSVGMLAGGNAMAAGAGDAKGYAVGWFQPAFNYGDGDCPEGLNPEIDWKAVFVAEGKTPEQVAELIAHPLSPDYMKAAIYRGPHGEDVCAVPTSMPDPGWKTVQGKQAYGMNLDGTADGGATQRSCKHEKFAGTDGAAGVDNQMYRVMGCSKSYRGKGHSAFVSAYINERMRTEGMRTYLVEIKGMTDPRNDDDVEVGIYVGADPLVQDAGTSVQPDTTQRVNKDVRWHNVVHGKVKDGVLTTNEFELNLLGDPMWIPEFHFKNAHLKLEFLPDGQVKGVVGGYLDLASVYFNFAKAPLSEILSSGNCPGTYYALKRAADGYPDPKTGECTAISTAWEINAVPAFIVHPPEDPKAKTAQIGAPAQDRAN